MPPQKMANRPVSTGFKDIDKLFELDGLRSGTLGLLRSQAGSSAQEFLLMMLSGNISNKQTSIYLSTFKSATQIRRDIENLGLPKPNEEHVVEMFESDFSDCINEITNMTDDVEIVIVDHINDLPMESKPKRKFMKELKGLADAKDCVVIMNYVDPDPHAPVGSEYMQVVKNTDYLFSLTKQYTDDNIRQKLWIEQLPLGEELSETHKDMRMIEMNIAENKLTLDTGGSI
jgi:hypothetical protein